MKQYIENMIFNNEMNTQESIAFNILNINNKIFKRGCLYRDVENLLTNLHNIYCMIDIDETKEVFFEIMEKFSNIDVFITREVFINDAIDCFLRNVIYCIKTEEDPIYINKLLDCIYTFSHFDIIRKILYRFKFGKICRSKLQIMQSSLYWEDFRLIIFEIYLEVIEVNENIRENIRSDDFNLIGEIILHEGGNVVDLIPLFNQMYKNCIYCNDSSKYRYVSIELFEKLFSHLSRNINRSRSNMIVNMEIFIACCNLCALHIHSKTDRDTKDRILDFILNNEDLVRHILPILERDVNILFDVNDHIIAVYLINTLNKIFTTLLDGSETRVYDSNVYDSLIYANININSGLSYKKSCIGLLEAKPSLFKEEYFLNTILENANTFSGCKDSICILKKLIKKFLIQNFSTPMGFEKIIGNSPYIFESSSFDYKTKRDIRKIINNIGNYTLKMKCLNMVKNIQPYHLVEYPFLCETG